MSTKQQIKIDTGVDWKFVIQYSIVFSILAYLIYIGGKSDKILINFYVARFNLILFTLLFIGWLCFCIITGKKIIETDTILYALLFLGVTFISVLLSENFWQSFNEFYLWGMYFLIFIGIKYLIYYGGNRELIFNCFLLIGSLSNITKIIQIVMWYSNWLINTNRGLLIAFQHRVDSPNQSAAFANLILMLALARFVNNKNNPKKTSLIFIILSSVFIVILTTSRGGMLGMVGGAGIIIAIRAIQEKGIIRKIWQNNRRFIFYGVIFFLVLIIIGVSSIISRSGLGTRYVFWMVAFQVFKNHPVFGSGLYTMGNQLLQSISVPPRAIHVHAHNIFLNILGELGIVGFGVFLLVIVNFLKNTFKINKSDNSYIKVGALGALGSFFSHGIVDTLYVSPYLTMSLIIIISMSSAPSKISKYTKKPIVRSASIWAAGFILCVGWVLLMQRVPLENAIRHYDQNKEYAVEDLKLLEKWKPNWSLGYQQRAITESFLAIEDKENQLEHLHIAIDYFKKAIKSDPMWATNYANLGILYKEIGDYSQALAMMKQASILAPESSLIALNYAIIAEETRDYELAKKYFWNYFIMGGIEDSGPFWHATTLRNKIYYQNRKMDFRKRYVEWNDKNAGWEMYPDRFDWSIHLKLAKYYLDRGEYQLVLPEIQQVELLGGRRGVNYLELLWLKSKMAIYRGEYSTGLNLAQTALDGWRIQSIYGPGTYGESNYSKQIHRSPSIDDDLIPQFEFAPIPDTWINRMVEIGKWYSEIDETEEAKKVFLEVISIDSNNEDAIALLKELDTNNNCDD